MILSIIGDLKADYGVYKAVEFAGPVLKEFSMSERMALCNMTTEMGAKTSYIQPDDITMAFLNEHGVGDYEIYHTDEDYVYAADLTYDVSGLEPQLAAPFSVDNVKNLTSLIGTHIDQAYLGSCTGGRTEDFAIAARLAQRQENPFRPPHGAGSRLQICAEGVHGKGIYPDTFRGRGNPYCTRLCRLSWHPSGTAGRRRGLHFLHESQFPGAYEMSREKFISAHRPLWRQQLLKEPLPTRESILKEGERHDGKDCRRYGLRVWEQCGYGPDLSGQVRGIYGDGGHQEIRHERQ